MILQTLEFKPALNHSELVCPSVFRRAQQLNQLKVLKERIGKNNLKTFATKGGILAVWDVRHWGIN